MVTRTALAAIAVAALTLPVGLIAPATASPRRGRRRPHERPLLGQRALEAQGQARRRADRDRGRDRQQQVRPGLALEAQAQRQQSRPRAPSGRAGRSGSFEVRRRMANLSGTDHFIFRADATAGRSAVARSRTDLALTAP